MQNMFLFELNEKGTASMDNWFWQACRSRRVQDHEWMIECDVGEFERLFRHREKFARRHTDINNNHRSESTHEGWPRYPWNEILYLETQLLSREI